MVDMQGRRHTVRTRRVPRHGRRTKCLPDNVLHPKSMCLGEPSMQACKRLGGDGGEWPVRPTCNVGRKAISLGKNNESQQGVEMWGEGHRARKASVVGTQAFPWKPASRAATHNNKRLAASLTEADWLQVKLCAQSFPSPLGRTPPCKARPWRAAHRHMTTTPQLHPLLSAPAPPARTCQKRHVPLAAVPWAPHQGL